jgi:hypothetical protein
MAQPAMDVTRRQSRRRRPFGPSTAPIGTVGTRRRRPADRLHQEAHVTVHDEQRPATEGGPTIEVYYLESRTFPPPPSFTAGALVSDDGLYREADADWQRFWARQAEELLDWYEPWQTICQWNLPDARWFDGGMLNASYNCLDRHVAA